VNVGLEDLVGLGGIILIQAIIEAFKATFPAFPSRFFPGLAMLVGIGLNEGLAAILRLDPATAAVVGLIAGLSASGLYAWGKAKEGQLSDHELAAQLDEDLGAIPLGKVAGFYAPLPVPNPTKPLSPVEQANVKNMPDGQP
jgi:hypothetical protein